jgi:hypothetical protein
MSSRPPHRSAEPRWNPQQGTLSRRFVRMTPCFKARIGAVGFGQRQEEAGSPSFGERAETLEDSATGET